MKTSVVVACALALLAVAAPGALAQRPAPRPVATFEPSPDRSVLTLTVARSGDAPGYRLDIVGSPFGLTTSRGAQTVLATPPSFSPEGPLVFQVSDVVHRATSLESYRWNRRTLFLTLATSSPEHKIAYRLTPAPDRYRVRWRVEGPGPVQKLGFQFDDASAGQWYGHGEAGNRPERQHWPLNTANGVADAVSPFDPDLRAPFWFTSSSVGLFVQGLVDVEVSLDRGGDGLDRFIVRSGTTADLVVFVERDPRAVYDDYIAAVGRPAKLDVTRQQFQLPVWNTWAQFYRSETQDRVLEYAEQLAAARLTGHALQIDGGWERSRGDFNFDRANFPDPRAMERRLAELGFDLGLWVSFFVNTDSASFEEAAANGYLLADGQDPSKPCVVTYWAGVAGIVDLANPDARAWYHAKLDRLVKRFGVDGFKFDTRFFDRDCAPRAGSQPADYLRLAGEVVDRYDLQGVGIRFPYNAEAGRGFASRQVDKCTDLRSLQAAVRQNLALSTIGYPYLATDMIGGSLECPPPLKVTLVRWAQAASLMPIMYSSTSPVGVTNPKTGASGVYDKQAVDLYRAALRRHARLAPYIWQRARETVTTGEPVMKPLFFDFPRERRAYTVDDQWMLGDAVLAAPVLTDQPGREEVYLPRGAWYDTLLGIILRGPARVPGYAADLERVPAFVRLGDPQTRAAAKAFAGRTATVTGVELTRKGTAAISISCPRTSASGCAGSVELGTVEVLRETAGGVLAVKRYDVPRGRRAVLRVRITRADRRLIEARGPVDAYAIATEGEGEGAAEHSLTTLRLAVPEPPPPPRPRPRRR